MFAGPLGRSTFTPPKSSFDSPLYGLVSLRRSHARGTRPPRSSLRAKPTGRGDQLLADREGSCFDLRDRRTVRLFSCHVVRAFGLRCDFDVVDRRTRFRDWLTQLAHLSEVGSQSVLEVSPRFFLAVANRRAARHVRGISGVSAVRGKLRQRTVSLYRSMSYGLFCPGTI